MIALRMRSVCALLAAAGFVAMAPPASARNIPLVSSRVLLPLFQTVDGHYVQVSAGYGGSLDRMSWVCVTGLSISGDDGIRTVVEQFGCVDRFSGYQFDMVNSDASVAGSTTTTLVERTERYEAGRWNVVDRRVIDDRVPLTFDVTWRGNGDRQIRPSAVLPYICYRGPPSLPVCVGAKASFIRAAAVSGVLVFEGLQTRAVVPSGQQGTAEFWTMFCC